MHAFVRRGGAASAGLCALLGACSSGTTEPVVVGLAPRLIFPRDILQNATSASLVVYDESTGASCNAATGATTGASATTPTLGSAKLQSCPASSTGKFCGTLTLAESSNRRIFSATASDSNGATLAQGCTSTVIDAANVSLSIMMVSSALAATCGNGVIEAGEQCDPPPAAGASDAVCDSACHSKEEVLSSGSSSPQGPAVILWPDETGRSEQLMCFFTDATGGGADNADVALRVMSSALEPATSPAYLGSALLAPNDSAASPPPSSAPGNQSEPSAAFVLGTYFYVFRDDAFGAPAIHMRSFDATLAADQPAADPIVLDGPESAPGADGGTGDAGAEQSSAPSVAVNGTGTLFVAWEDVAGPTAGQILGRTYTPTGGSLGLVSTVSTSSSANENVRVAGTATGWVVVWDDTTRIKMRVYSGNGTPNGPEIIVSNVGHIGTQDHPGAAVLDDGRVAVVWADHGSSQGADIFVQRYDANFVAVPGDQTDPINDVIVAGDQVTPAIAGAAATGGSFFTAWIDSPSGQVRGRVLDGTTGFDANPVDATDSEFQVSLASGQTRENPAVAVGGDGPWVAIGWDVGGVVSVRRFPTSTNP
jgi:hypothetical protein